MKIDITHSLQNSLRYTISDEIFGSFRCSRRTGLHSNQTWKILIANEWSISQEGRSIMNGDINCESWIDDIRSKRTQNSGMRRNIFNRFYRFSLNIMMWYKYAFNYQMFIQFCIPNIKKFWFSLFDTVSFSRHRAIWLKRPKMKKQGKTLSQLS